MEHMRSYMRVKKLKLVNFRNYSELTIQFHNNINIFIGKNAQGKTSLLESIYLLSISKSHKTHKDKEMIHFNQSFAKVSGQIEKANDAIDLEIIISSQGKKALINSVEKRKISEFIGSFNVVMFAPEDLDIVKRDPANRRKFLDVEIGQTSSIYIHSLSQYNKILKQRNEYLKQAYQNNNLDENYLDILTSQLAEMGALILKKRHDFIMKLNHYANQLHTFISNHQENLTIEYVSTYDKCMDAHSIFNLYRKNYTSDFRRGTTQLGIHRDDLIFFVNGVNVSHFGSQGQQRTTALAIKLSLIDFIKDETGHYPIVLLDDVLSELDDIRQTHLLDCIKEKVQTFVTTTNISGIKNEIVSKADIFRIDQANICREEKV
jgi:DNA replication and repair protein RecF